MDKQQPLMNALDRGYRAIERRIGRDLTSKEKLEVLFNQYELYWQYGETEEGREKGVQWLIDYTKSLKR